MNLRGRIRWLQLRTALALPPTVRVRLALLKLGGGKPMGRQFGYDRGGHSVAREYIQRFIDAQASDIRGRVLEIGDARYTLRHSAHVTRSDVLHPEEGAGVTVVCDLTEPGALEGLRFDTVICTQTLEYSYEPNAMLEPLCRSLERGGVMLATVSGFIQISSYDMERWGEYWRFTPLSARRLFEDVFGREAQIDLRVYGNVLAASAQLAGLAAHELKPSMLDPHDPDFPIVIGVRAQKAASVTS